MFASLFILGASWLFAALAAVEGLEVLDHGGTAARWLRMMLFGGMACWGFMA